MRNSDGELDDSLSRLHQEEERKELEFTHTLRFFSYKKIALAAALSIFLEFALRNGWHEMVASEGEKVIVMILMSPESSVPRLPLRSLVWYQI